MSSHETAGFGDIPDRPHLSHYPQPADYDTFLDGLSLGWGTEEEAVMYTDCPKENKEGCPYAPDCLANTHHRYWPKPDYRTRTEREFRGLPANKEQLCLWEHKLVHATTEPPVKPSLQEMLQALGRPLVDESTTSAKDMKTGDW